MKKKDARSQPAPEAAPAPQVPSHVQYVEPIYHQEKEGSPPVLIGAMFVFDGDGPGTWPREYIRVLHNPDHGQVEGMSSFGFKRGRVVMLPESANTFMLQFTQDSRTPKDQRREALDRAIDLARLQK